MTQRKLRITILGLNYSPEPTGNAPYTTSLAEGLTAAGHSVEVVTGYPHYPEWKIRSGYSGWSRCERINGVDVRRVRHRVPQKPNALSRLHMELSFGARIMLAPWNRPDVVLLVSPALFSSAMAILRVHLQPRRPAVGIWVQDLYSRGIVETGTGGRGLSRISALVEATILRSTDGVVAIHDRFKGYMVESLGLPASKIRVIRNWTHLPPSPTSGAAKMRAKLGWSLGETVVLHAGNMGKKQGLENVLDAARLAEETNSDVRFVLMGDGNQREYLQAKSRGLSHLEFVDPLPGDEFSAALSAADVLLVNELPGVKDMAVPSKLTSYFNSGVPVVAATDAGSVTAMEIEASGGGIRVDAADPQALLQAVESLGQDKERSSTIGAQGLRFRHETLSEAVALGHYDEFLSGLAMSRSR